MLTAFNLKSMKEMQHTRSGGAGLGSTGLHSLGGALGLLLGDLIVGADFEGDFCFFDFGLSIFKSFKASAIFCLTGDFLPPFVGEGDLSPESFEESLETDLLRVVLGFAPVPIKSNSSLSLMLNSLNNSRVIKPKPNEYLRVNSVNSFPNLFLEL